MQSINHPPLINDKSFTFLSNEIITHIFGYLSPTDLDKCQKVCGLWKGIIHTHFPKVFLSYYGSYSHCLRNLEAIEDIKTRVKKIQTESSYNFSGASFPRLAFEKPIKSQTSALCAKGSLLYGGTEQGKIIIWDQETRQIIQKIQTAIKKPINFLKIQNDQLWIIQDHLRILSLEGKFIKEATHISLTQGKIMDIQDQQVIQLQQQPSYKLLISKPEEFNPKSLKLNQLKPDASDSLLVSYKSNHLFAWSQKSLICWDLATKTALFSHSIEGLFFLPVIGKRTEFVQLIIKHHIAIIHAKGHPLMRTGIDDSMLDTNYKKSFFYVMNLKTGHIKHLADIEDDIHDNCIFKNNKLIHSYQFSRRVEEIDCGAPPLKTPPASESTPDANSGTMAKLVRKLSFRKGK